MQPPPVAGMVLAARHMAPWRSAALLPQHSLLATPPITILLLTRCVGKSSVPMAGHAGACPRACPCCLLLSHRIRSLAARLACLGRRRFIWLSSGHPKPAMPSWAQARTIPPPPSLPLQRQTSLAYRARRDAAAALPAWTEAAPAGSVGGKKKKRWRARKRRKRAEVA